MSAAHDAHPATTVKAKMVTLTPELAEQLLARNTHNRTVSRPRVAQYAADMRAGHWAFNGEAIKITASTASRRPPTPTQSRRSPMPPSPDQVDHPPHYTFAAGFEPIDVIEAWGLGFHLGNAVKYVARAGRKGDALTDLQKARWYLDRQIALVEREQQRFASIDEAARIYERFGGDR